MSDWLYSIANASPPFVLLAVVATGFGFYTGFVSLRRYRLIEDVPTARIRSAPQGYVELVGQAVMMPGEPIVAPLSQTQCCWFAYRVERKSGKSWSTVDSGASDGLFILRDDTGECLVDPEGAEVDSVHSKSWYGDRTLWGGIHRRSPDGSAHHAGGLGSALNLNVQLGVSGYRYSEQVILDGDPVYAIGWFKSFDDADRAEGQDALTRQLLREWKQRPDTLRERFDHNRDGVVDLQEWEDARKAAKHEAAQHLARELSERTHLHTLSKPASRQFLIANRHQDALVSHHKWRSILGFALFFVAGAVASLMVTTQFFGG